AASAFTPRPVPEIATPTPAPKEPVRYTTNTSSGAGWTVQRAPALGTNDNSLGAVAAASWHDVWAVGNFLPDTKATNHYAPPAGRGALHRARVEAPPGGQPGPELHPAFRRGPHAPRGGGGGGGPRPPVLRAQPDRGLARRRLAHHPDAEAGQPSRHPLLGGGG